MKEIVRNWDMPVNEWTQGTVIDYVVWVKDTYGEEEAKKLFAYAKGYRAIKDAMVVEEPIDRQPTKIITSQKIVDEALAIMDNIFKEEYSKHEHNLT